MYFQYNRKRKEVENISSTLSMKLYPTNFKKAISIDDIDILLIKTTLFE